MTERRQPPDNTRATERVAAEMRRIQTRRTSTVPEEVESGIIVEEPEDLATDDGSIEASKKPFRVIAVLDSIRDRLLPPTYPIRKPGSPFPRSGVKPTDKQPPAA